MRARVIPKLFVAAAVLGAGGVACGHTADQYAGDNPSVSVSPSTSPPPTSTEATSTAPPDSGGLATDAKLYFTAPLRWNATEWAWFAGALLATGASHHYDADVRTHFAKLRGSPVTTDNYNLQDALPTLLVVGGTWFYAGLIEDSNGHRETWAMLESAAFSIVPAYVVQFASGRASPNETTSVNAWREVGRGSFPSYHTTAAFAVGTVLAESGNDEYRWVRRLLGYGLGAVTGYERMKHNQHWLSDTVAGAALGIASAHFAMGRAYHTAQGAGLGVIPVEGGAMLTYRVSLP